LPVLWDEVHPAGLGRLLQIDLNELEVLGVAVGPEHGLAPQVRHVVVVGLEAQAWNQDYGSGSAVRSALIWVAGSGSRRETNDPQNIKKVKNFHVLKCSMFFSEG